MASFQACCSSLCNKESTFHFKKYVKWFRINCRSGDQSCNPRSDWDIYNLFLSKKLHSTTGSLDVRIVHQFNRMQEAMPDQQVSQTHQKLTMKFIDSWCCISQVSLDADTTWWFVIDNSLLNVKIYEVTQIDRIHAHIPSGEDNAPSMRFSARYRHIKPWTESSSSNSKSSNKYKFGIFFNSSSYQCLCIMCTWLALSFWRFQGRSARWRYLEWVVSRMWPHMNEKMICT